MGEWLLGLASSFWQWLHDASQGQATFLGWVVGFVTLLVGALFNAHLNRRRDDRLRGHDQRSVAMALRAELVGLSDRLQNNTKLLKEPELGEIIRGPPELPAFSVPDLGHLVRVFPEMVEKLGLLDPDTIRSVIDAHLAVEQHSDHMLQWGGSLRNDLPSHGRVVDVSSERAELVIFANEGLLGVLQTAIDRLGRYAGG